MTSYSSDLCAAALYASFLTSKQSVLWMEGDGRRARESFCGVPESTESGNTGPCLADNQSRDLNINFCCWLFTCVGRFLVPANGGLLQSTYLHNPCHLARRKRSPAFVAVRISLAFPSTGDTCNQERVNQ
eukprot:sb/3475224/